MKPEKKPLMGTVMMIMMKMIDPKDAIDFLASSKKLENDDHHDDYIESRLCSLMRENATLLPKRPI